ncbi:putative short chain dehydrogenase reductase [Rosellinia necatrix]|uniref:Putative short chain dehydrogenase reductase n=1 Tax=Rosellinia necatrix TaxID=77044 RepID=A0A1W2TJ69_ROSNE|nr:putative short chain dehydrogenase reductase [Rosellinia necatrix]
MASFLVTGASRGLGLAFVRELISRPTSEVGLVFAGTRGDAPTLDEIVDKSSGRLVVVKLDVTDQVSIKKAAAEVEAKLGGKGLDVLINNAGIAKYVTDGIKSMDNLEESFTTNVMGVHWVTREFLPLLQKGTLKKVANISTPMGCTSIAKITAFLPVPAYKVSKAALNALTAHYAVEYEKEGFSFIALCPGWIKTDFGGDDAHLTPEEGAKGSLDIILTEGQKYNGKFQKTFVKGWENNREHGPEAYDGTELPW